MSENSILAVTNVSKSYRIWNTPASRVTSPMISRLGALFPDGSSLRRKMSDRAEAAYRDFWALSDVSFELRRGESMGIIGRNGSGKSTLLQIIAGTLQPTTGNVIVRGRVAALLELGSGFNPEFTGRENVYLNGTVLGLSRREIDHRFSEITDFADIGNFIDQPVKTYSSGMTVRLAFAVQIAIEPDLLIVDEALSVGDIFFQQKCFRRLRELKEKGTAFLLVSHDTTAVTNLCAYALWLQDGHTRQKGDACDVIPAYVIGGGPGTSGRNNSGTTRISDQLAAECPSYPPLDLSHCQRIGDRRIQISQLWLGVNGTSTVPVGSWVELVLRIEAKFNVLDVSAGFEIRDRMGQVICATGLRSKGLLIPCIEANGSRLIKLRFQNLLAPGRYTIDVGCGNSDPQDNASDRVLGAVLMESILTEGDEPVHGFCRLPTAAAVGILQRDDNQQRITPPTIKAD